MSSELDAALSLRVTASPALAARDPREIVRSGAEVVELCERFYRGIFLSLTAFVGLAALGALVLLPLRAGPGGPPVTGVIAGSLLVFVTPLALWRVEGLYRTLRRQPYAELIVVAIAAALVSVVFPLRSQLWWPSCALLMLLAVIAPVRRVLLYCVAVLAMNLIAHLMNGDIDRTPAVSIIGLWIGYIFWALTVAAVVDRLAAHLLRINTLTHEPDSGTRRVASWIDDQKSEPRSAEASRSVADERGRPGSAGEQDSGLVIATPELAANRLERLTARQLEVVALLVDGLRYREVAECLSISARQVQRHVATAVTRLGVANAVELVAVARAEGLVSPTDPLAAPSRAEVANGEDV